MASSPTWAPRYSNPNLTPTPNPNSSPNPNPNLDPNPNPNLNPNQVGVTLLSRGAVVCSSFQARYLVITPI